MPHIFGTKHLRNRVAMMVNFDNAATTFPKPESVKRAALRAITVYGGNPGRSGHKLSLAAAEQVYSVREKCAEMFGCEPENVVFTSNCTLALNMAIKGIMQGGGEIICSDLEHNSVSRPIFALSEKNCSFSVAHISENDDETIENFSRLINSKTKAIACTAGSNVTGQITPFRRIGELCKSKGICFIVDGAQTCGVIPMNIKEDNINILCAAGHKGLYGTTGTGLLVTDGKYQLETIVEGGSGSNSLELVSPPFLPDRLEAGTLNTVGIISLGAGVDFVRKTGINTIFSHETALCDSFVSFLRSSDKFTVYRKNASYLPVVSFNLDGLPSDKLASMLSDEGFALRGGFHCASLAHNTLGTTHDGAVRFAPSAFNNRSEVNRLCEKLKKISIST